MSSCLRRWFKGKAWGLLLGLLLHGAAAPAQRLAADEHLRGLVIWAAAPDPAGWVWLATDRGGFRYDGEHLVPLAGLALTGPHLATGRLLAVLRDAASGTVWWGGDAGLWALEPASGRLRAVSLPSEPAAQTGVTALGQHGGRLWVGLGADPLRVLSLDPRRPAAPPRLELRAAAGNADAFACDSLGRWQVLGRQATWGRTRAGRWQQHRYPEVGQGLLLVPGRPARWLPQGGWLALPGTAARWRLHATGLYECRPGRPSRLVQGWRWDNPETPQVLRVVERDSTWYWSAGAQVFSLSLRGLATGQAPRLRRQRAPLPFGRELELVPLPGGQGALLGFRRDAPGAVRLTAAELPLRALPPHPRQPLSTRAFGRLPDGRLFVSSYQGLFTQAADSPLAPLRRLATTATTQAGVWLATLPLPGGRLLVANEVGLFDVWAAGRRQPLPWAGPHPTLLETNGLCLLHDAAGRYWGGSVAGLFAIDAARGQVRRYREADAAFALHGRRIEALAEGPAGVLWVATGQGLYRLTVATGQLVRYGPDEPAPRRLPTADVRCLVFAHPDSLWLGTFDQGLLLLDPRRGLRRRVGPGQGLPSASVASVARLPADAGALWLGTYRGLVRYRPAGGQLTAFAQAQGLAADECNRQSLWYEAARGQLYVGGVGGASRLDLRQALSRPAPPRPALLLAAVRQHHAATGRSTTAYPAPGRAPALVLAPGDAYADVELAVADYTPDARPRFAHRLLAAGPAVPPPWLWQEGSTVRLQGLAPGDYRLQLRGETAAGTPASEELALPLRVELPWLRRPLTWAGGAGLLALAAGAAVYGWQRLRLARVRAAQQLRAQLAADLHDEVGNLLARVALRAELARDLPDPPALEALLAESRAAAATVRDLIWTVDAAADTAGALADRLQDLLAQSAAAAGRAAHFTRRPEPFPAQAGLRPDVRQHAYLIGREALTNALKYAPAGAALTLTLAVSAEELYLEVGQEGGLAAAAVPVARTGQGLRNMHARAARLGATFSAGPAAAGADGAGPGWRVTLRVPRPLA